MLSLIPKRRQQRQRQPAQPLTQPKAMREAAGGWEQNQTNLQSHKKEQATYNYTALKLHIAHAIHANLGGQSELPPNLYACRRANTLLCELLLLQLLYSLSRREKHRRQRRRHSGARAYRSSSSCSVPAEEPEG